MARLPRFILPGQPQHVIQRGNNRNEIFCAEADYRFYLDKLKAAAAKHGCAIHAYVFMTNHVHDNFIFGRMACNACDQQSLLD